MNKIFYKYRKINDLTIDSLKNHYFYLANPSNFNDLDDTLIPNEFKASFDEIINWGEKFDQHPAVVSFLAKNPSYLNSPTFLKKMAKIPEKIRGLCHIFCVTEESDNNIMWEKYGDLNAGICIGYESVFKADNYLLEIVRDIGNHFVVYDPNDENKIYLVLTKVKYDRTSLEPYNPFKHDTAKVRSGFLSKAPKWSDENEYRAIIMDLLDTNFDPKIPYNKSILKEIIFGSKRQKSKKIKVITTIQQNYNIKNINFFEMHIDESMNLIKRECDCRKIVP
jgi:hypothetical protein